MWISFATQSSAKATQFNRIKNAARSLGKYYGAYGSCKAVKCAPKITKYLGITLLPQAGEIRPEGKTSARTINQPKPPVNIY